MKKIVAFGSGNALAAICGVINSNPQSDMSVYRVSEEMSVVHNDKTTNFYLTLPDGKQIAKTLHRSPLLLEDLYWIKNADAYLVDGTWGSTNPKRQWKPAKIYLEEERNLYHGRPSTGVRSARMEFMNVFVQELAKMYNIKVIVTTGGTFALGTASPVRIDSYVSDDTGWRASRSAPDRRCNRARGREKMR